MYSRVRKSAEDDSLSGDPAVSLGGKRHGTLGNFQLPWPWAARASDSRRRGGEEERITTTRPLGR